METRIQKDLAASMKEKNTLKTAALREIKTAIMKYKTAADYTAVSNNLTNSTSLLYDMARNIIGKYSYEQVIDVNVQNQIKAEILAALKDTFNTECIYSVSFYNWVAQ
mgnify:CR=1 FL=1